MKNVLRDLHQVENEDGVVNPHRDEDYKPGPSGSLIQTQNLFETVSINNFVALVE